MNPGKRMTTQDYIDEINRLEAENEKLRYEVNTVHGLWATDRPDLVKDPKKVMFRIHCFGAKDVAAIEKTMKKESKKNT